MQKKRYSNTESEAVGTPYRLEKFHSYCFARQVSIIKDQKLLVAIFKKDVATLSQTLQYIYLEHTNTESESYTNLDQIYS